MRDKAIRDLVLVLDGDAEFRSQVTSALSEGIAGIEIVQAQTGEEAWSTIVSGTVTLAILSFASRDVSALELLHRIQIHRLSTRVVVTSGHVQAQEVVEHIKAGAFDFLERPFSTEQLIMSASQLMEKIRMERIEITEPELELTSPELIGTAPPVKAIRDLLDQVAPTNSTILVTGESGTGKEIVARTIHRKSKRKDQPFVVVDCGTIPAGLVESELFGYVSGAFTGASGDKRGLLEQANHGTAFFDEVGEFPLDLQVKLLRVLQDGEVRRVGSDKVTKLDLRIIAATNKELEREVRLGRFRQDLYYRLNVVHVQMPPLRDRPQDIETFVNYFLRKYQREYDHQIRGITRGAMGMLKNYEWPGNVRELEHTILQIMALHNRKAIIEERDMPMFLERRGNERQHRFLEEALDLKLSLEDYSREFVRMFEAEYTEKELASSLGITTKTLWQKRRKWSMERKKRA
ncbi:MAG TPA: sigma-54 dependent transcriptional regulator [bacterium]|nr:sigma-54 dependent transcriptional regulator [bacterium]